MSKKGPNLLSMLFFLSFFELTLFSMGTSVVLIKWPIWPHKGQGPFMSPGVKINFYQNQKGTSGSQNNTLRDPEVNSKHLNKKFFLQFCIRSNVKFDQISNVKSFEAEFNGEFSGTNLSYHQWPPKVTGGIKVPSLNIIFFQFRKEIKVEVKWHLYDAPFNPIGSNS